MLCAFAGVIFFPSSIAKINRKFQSLPVDTPQLAAG
jgi:hypothetical protein